ncbi:MAG: outer membrane protein assembly factor BamA [Proteobacteria bacterium]|nr:outer membrane protein assembly factor BamA [Pseudomonadota bacterium]
MKKILLSTLLLAVGLLGFVAEARALTLQDPKATLPPVVASAQPSKKPMLGPGGTVIRKINVEGTQRIEAGTVLSYLALAQGQEATRAKLNESLKNLFATGFFSDATLDMQPDGTLKVMVKENPVINRVVFEGNSAINEKDLEKEIQIKPRQVYTKSRVKSDVQRILDLYRRSGRFAAIVEPKIIRLEQNRIDLVFEITEGDRTGVRRIRFVGNHVFDDDALRDAVNTRETAWWRFFSSSDYYDPDRMNYDKDLLRRFYLNAGYVDFRVISAHAELIPDRKDFVITFTVEEGPRYRFGKVDVSTTLKGINMAALREKVVVHSGEWYSAERVEKSVAQLTAVIGDLQYAFVQVQPKIEPDRKSHVVTINFVINQGPRVFVESININGNTRTLDRVIRRQVNLAEGDPLIVSRVKKSEQNIRDLGFFEDVKVTQSEGILPDQSVINVAVKEKPTGEISIGAGYSSTDGPLGDFSIRERNLLGKGQDLRFSIQASPRTQQYDVSFTEPYFLERDLAAGADIFRVVRSNQDSSSFSEERNGVNLRLGYPLSEFLRQTLNYSLSQTSITDVPATASRYVREQAGSAVVSLVGQELSYDKRNSKLDPTKGYFVKLNTDLAGLGGDVDYVRARLGGGYYVPVTESEKWILNLFGEAGYIAGLGQKVRINDRFYLGGDTLRGFEYAGIGPRDKTGTADDALGGNRYVRTRIELTFPTGLPEEFGLRGRVFNDSGILDSVEVNPLPGEDLKRDSALRSSVGVGLTWASPFGPIGIDLAKPILQQSYDKTEFFRFSFGTHL